MLQVKGVLKSDINQRFLHKQNKSISFPFSIFSFARSSSLYLYFFVFLKQFLAIRHLQFPFRFFFCLLLLLKCYFPTILTNCVCVVPSMPVLCLWPLEMIFSIGFHFAGKHCPDHQDDTRHIVVGNKMTKNVLIEFV